MWPIYRNSSITRGMTPRSGQDTDLCWLQLVAQMTTHLFPSLYPFQLFSTCFLLPKFFGFFPFLARVWSWRRLLSVDSDSVIDSGFVYAVDCCCCRSPFGQFAYCSPFGSVLPSGCLFPPFWCQTCKTSHRNLKSVWGGEINGKTGLRAENASPGFKRNTNREMGESGESGERGNGNKPAVTCHILSYMRNNKRKQRAAASKDTRQYEKSWQKSLA